MRRILLAAAVIVAAIGFTAGPALASSNSNTSVSLYRPFPNGIDSTNAAHAWQQVSGRAGWDSQYAGVIAQQTGATKFVASQYKPLGYQNGMPGTTNSALSGAGMVVPLADHNGSGSVTVLVVVNIATSKTVAIMVRCGNPRLAKTPYVAPLPWKNFSKGTVLRVHRTITKPVVITCPSGQKVSGSLNVVFNGIVRGSTWGKVQGSLTEHLRVGLKAQLKAWVKLKCGPAPKAVPKPSPKAVPKPKPTPTATVTCPVGSAKDSAGNCVAVAVSCPTGTVKDSNGNCVTQTNIAAQDCQVKGGNYDNNTGLCTIVQVTGNCSTIIVVNGSGNTVNTTTTGNCNNNPPAPAAQYSCTNLSVSNSGGNTVTAAVSYTATGGATFQSASYNWGDGATNNDGTSASHTYGSSGGKTITATVTFNVGSSTATAACSGSITITPPPATITFSPSCSAVLTADKSNRVASLTAGGTASNGSTPSGAGWTLTKNGVVVGTPSGLSTSFQFVDQLTTYNWTAVVQWSAGSATCSGSIQTGVTSPPLP
ncbi:MAG: hypothetical protein Q7R60_02445 [bacterium]|nr:hypothetical protein [bacterium]